MFAYIKGILTASNPSCVTVEACGIGYSLFIPYRAFGELPQLGEPLCLHTSFVVREFGHSLYGFLSSQERDVFEVLMNVTGIGPKLALSLIGHLSFSDLQCAVRDGHLATLCKVPGVGKKTAERLVVELRDKLPSFLPPDPKGLALSIPGELQEQKVKDAMLALINLGYQQGTAQKALKQSLNELPEDADLASLITTALKHI